MMDDGTPRDDPRRPRDESLSRRRLLTGLAGTAGLLGVSLASRVAFGGASTAGTPGANGHPGPDASPAGSPAASPMASPAAAHQHQIRISSFAFMPATIQVAVGAEISWTNRDDIPHTVTSDDGASFASAVLDTDDTFQQRFTKPGTYSYHCALHPFMTAKVIVR